MSSRPALMRLSIPGPSGTLEALLQEHADAALAAVICHPHPLFGGTMDNPVAYRLARAFVERGVTTLRFNFRGVGGSPGRYGQGVEEEADVAAALDYLAGRASGARLLVAGYSFGAWVGSKVAARERRVAGYLGVGVAVQMFDHGALAALALPKALVQGTRDQFAPPAEFEALAAALPEPKHVETLEGASHYFDGRYADLERALADAVSFLSGQALAT